MKHKPILLLALCALAQMAQAQDTNTRTPHSSMWITAPARGTFLPFQYSAEGTEYRVLWGMDTAWDSSDNVTRGTNFIGKNFMGTGRISFQPSDLVDEEGNLSTAQKNALKSRINHIKLSGVTDVVLNCDHEVLCDHENDATWTARAQKARANYQHKPYEWYRVIKASVLYAKSLGINVVTVSPYNEPDYTAWNEGSQAEFKEIAKYISEDPDMEGIRISAGNTLNCDQALSWYNGVKPYVTEGNTHQLAGSFDNYAKFFSTVRADGNWATADELHNVMEAMVGIQYGMQSGIWWGAAGVARGDFCQANTAGGARLGYAENRSAWTAASVYRLPNGKVEAFLGTSERQATTSAYDIVSTDRACYYDGYGPVNLFNMIMPGGTGYQKGQTNSERMIQIHSGADVPQQPLDGGTYVIMNQNSKYVMTIQNGSTSNGAALVQGTYTGTNSNPYQQWKVEALESRPYDDFSYCYIRSTRNNDMLVDLLNWGTASGVTYCVYPGGGGGNEQWIFEYAGDNQYYIRSRHSGLYMGVRSNSTTNGAYLEQQKFTGHKAQRWRLMPVDAARELVAPAAPTGLAAAGQTGSVRLTWEANADEDIDCYNVLRNDASGESTAWEVIGRNIKGTEFIDNSCTLGTSHTYAIVAVDHSGNRSELSATAEAQPNTTRGLIAQYQFDENVYDASDNQLDPALCGAVSISTSSTNVKSGTGSINFNGTGHYLLLPTAAGDLRELTIATWVNMSTISNGNWQRLFDFGNGTDQYMFFTPNNGSEARLVLKNGGAEQILSMGSKLTSGWKHLAITMSDTETKIYLNGELKATTTDITIRPADFHPVLNYVGRSQFSSDPLFKGRLDDFRIYNYALSAEDVVSISKNELIDAIDAPATSTAPVIATEYFSADGQQLSSPRQGKGIVILRQRRADGSMTTQKIVR